MNKQCPSLYSSTPRVLLCFLLLVLTSGRFHTASAQQQHRMVRLAELDIDPAHFSEYNTILAEEAATSVRLEPGVLVIFPMYQKEKPTSVRILEIYASQEAYEQHIKSPHFLKYKTLTLKMVKSLKLIDMEAVDAATMPLLFRKLTK